MLHGHGNNTLDYDHKINTDFSSNIWYEPLNNGLLEYLKSCLSKISDYPPVDAFNLQKKIADNNYIDVNNVCVTSGATEAFYLIAHCFANTSSTIIAPSFSEYADAALMYRHKLDYLSNDKLNEDSIFTSQLVWIGNPNNPDGKVLSKEMIEILLRNNPKSVFIIDEAYGELCSAFESALDLISKYKNLVLVKSVTKLCSIPGLRLGFLMASENLMNKIAALRMPWSVATLALEAGLYIYDHYDHFRIDLKRIKRECTLFQESISSIEGVEVLPSCTNYFLSKLKTSSVKQLKENLIAESGFLIRDCSNFYGLDEHHFRLAVQGDENNMACAQAIANFLNR